MSELEEDALLDASEDADDALLDASEDAEADDGAGAVIIVLPCSLAGLSPADPEPDGIAVEVVVLVVLVILAELELGAEVEDMLDADAVELELETIELVELALKLALEELAEVVTLVVELRGGLLMRLPPPGVDDVAAADEVELLVELAITVGVGAEAEPDGMPDVLIRLVSALSPWFCYKAAHVALVSSSSSSQSSSSPPLPVSVVVESPVGDGALALPEGDAPVAESVESSPSSSHHGFAIISLGSGTTKV